MNLGGRISQRLDELGWKQVDLVDRVPGLDAATLSALIKRDSRRSNWATQIAAALNVSVEYLLTGEHPSGASTTGRPTVGKPSNFLRRLSEFQKEYETLPASERELVDEALKQQAELRRLLKGGDERA